MTAPRSPLAYFGIEPESRDARILRLVVQTVVQGVDADEGSLLVAEPEAGDLYFAMTIGDAESEKTLLGQRVPMGQGLTGLAAATQEVQIGSPTFSDVKQTDRKSTGPEAVLAAPLVTGDRLIGVVTAVSFREGKRFTARDATFAGQLATIAAVLVDQTMRLAGAPGEPARAALDQQVDSIAAHHPEALPQLAAMLASFKAALASRRR